MIVCRDTPNRDTRELPPGQGLYSFTPFYLLFNRVLSLSSSFLPFNHCAFSLSPL